MSPTSWLQQISVQGLQRIKHNPEIFQAIIMDITPANLEDTELVTALSDLTESQLDLLNSITPNAERVLNRWSVFDVELLESLKEYEPDLFSQLKQHLFLIVEAEKRCTYLDLGWMGSLMRILFQYGTRMEPLLALSTVCIAGEDHKRVNIFSGKPVYPGDEFANPRYQEPETVAEIARVLSAFDDQEIRCRFEYAVREQPSAYGKIVLEERRYQNTLDYCKAVRELYMTASEQGFGVVSVLS